MPKRANPEMTDDDNPEWNREDVAHAGGLSALPEEHQRILKGIMEQRAAEKKLLVHLSSDVVEKMQSTGEGWELRIEEAVRQWLARQNKRRRMAS